MTTHRTFRLAVAGFLTVVSTAIVGPASPVAAGQIGADDVKLTTGEAPRGNQLAYDSVNDRYLAVWTDGASAPERIRGMVITSAGVAGAPFTIHTATDVLEPAVAANTVSGGWMVALVTEEAAGAREIAVSSVTSSGTTGFASPASFVSAMGASGDPNYDARRPAIAFNPGALEYAVVWDGDDTTTGDGQDDLWARRLGAGGGPLSAQVNLTGPTPLLDEVNPSIAFGAGRYVVVYEELDLGTGLFQIHNITVDGNLANPTAPRDMTTGLPTLTDVIDPRVAAGAGGSVFVFEGRNASNLLSAWAGFIDPVTGVHSNVTQISGAPSAGFEADDVQVAFHPTTGHYAIVWEGERSGVTAADEEEIFSTIVVAPNLTILEPIERISTMGVDNDTTNYAFSPAVAPGPGVGFRTVWSGINADAAAGADQTTAGDDELFVQGVGPTADLSVTSVTAPVSPTPPLAGSVVQYSVAISNAGPASASGVTVTATVPTGLVIEGITAGNVFTGNVPGTIAAAGSTAFTVDAAIAAGAAKGQTIAPTFTAVVSTGFADPTGNNSGTAPTITVDGPPVVSAFTVASNNSTPSLAKVGDVITASITTDEAINTPTVTIAGVAASVTGSGTTWSASITVTGTTPQGAASAQITAATDLAGIAMVTPVSSSNSVTVDRTVPAPTITSTATDPTNTSPFDVTVDFGETVTGFVSGDLVVANGTAAAATGGANGVYTVAVTPTSDGLVTVDLGSAAASDLAGNASTAATQFGITYDGTAPAPTITSGETDPTSTSPFDVTVDFGETVTGFESSDLVVTNGTAAAATGGTNGAYTVAITPTADGAVTVDLAAGVAADAAGNTNAAATQFSIGYDGTAPTVTVEQAVGQADPTNGDSVQFIVTFSEPVTGFGSADVDLSNSTTLGTLAAAIAGGPAVYTVTVDGFTGDGIVDARVVAGAAVDGAGTGNAASTSTDNQVTVDRTEPTSQLVQAAGQSDPTNGDSVQFTVTFSESVTGFGGADVDLSNSTTPGTLAAAVTGGPAVYTVTVDGYTGDGVVDARVGDGVANDAAGNASLAMPSLDFQIEVDRTSPTVDVEQAATQADPTNTSPIEFTVTFSEDVTGFAASDVGLSGSAGATTATVTPVSAAEYTVEVSGMIGDGDVVVTVAAGAAVDTAGNGNDASTSTDDTVAFDTTSPTVTIDQGATQTDSANTSPIVFDVVFSEDVTGFTGADVVVSGTAGATTATVTPVSGSAYTVEVGGMTGNGTVIASIAVGAAVDAAGNTSGAGTSTDNVVTYIAGDVTPGVNDAPVITAPAAVAAELGVARAFGGSASVAITDPDALDGDLVVTLAIDTGALALGSTSGLTVTGTSSAWTLTGGLADLNAALATLTTTIVDVGTSTISIGVDDQGNTDGAALNDSATIIVTVADTTAPTIVVPSATVTASSEPGKAGATVTYQVTVNDRGSAPLTERFVESTSADRFIEIEPAPTLACSPASGSFFPIGETTVNCTATDSSGNVGTASFAVVVVDDEDPVISGAGNQTYALEAAGSGAVTYVPPSATDNSGNVILTCTPPSGSVMSAGVRTITCTASDPSGNTAMASFAVTVTSGRIPDTGGGGLPLLPWAVGLVAIGAFLVGGTRRRSA